MSATPTSDAIPLSGNANIDGLVEGGAWLDGGGSGVTLTYSFAYDPAFGALPWSSQQKGYMTQALESWANVADINLVQLPDIAGGKNYPAAPSDLVLIAAGYSGLTGLLGIGYFPDPAFADDDFTNGLLGSLGYTRANYPQPEGDLFLFDDDPYFPTVKPGMIGFETVVHELGHTLGMKHPHDNGGDLTPPLRPTLPIAFDSEFYTVMSYNDVQTTLGNTETPPLVKGFVTTPMPLDIIAIQSIYGANYNAHTGNDTYVLKQDGQVKTIWDAGGIDTITAGGLFGPITIDLHGTDPNNPNYLNYINEGDGFSFVAMSCYVQDVSKTFVVNYIENAIGTGAADILIGNETDNTLDGGAGADNMTGDIGNDTFVIDNIGDQVTENVGEGNDTIISSLTMDLSGLAAEIENLTLSGGAKINGTGTAADNILIGNTAINTLTAGLGNDTVNGGGGADTMIGGDGNDTYYVDNAKDIITENFGEGTDSVFSTMKYTLGSDLENLTLTGKGGNAGTGNGGDNIITGNVANNALFGLVGTDTLDGGAGNDTLDGGTGADSMTGGLGDDIFIVDSALDVVFENPGEGKDLVKASASVSVVGPEGVGVENITLTGVASIDATGNALNNIITGNAGNNILDGGAGADKLTGGAGNDTYVVDNLGDVISDTSGNDTVVTGIAYLFGKSSVLATGFENLTFTGALDLDGTGNSSVNIMTGNAGFNLLDGGSGNDTLDGGNGDDILAGGAGTDTLTGGVGSDTFRFNVAPAQGGIDIVTDFTNGPGGDVIDVTDILQGYTLGATISDFVHTANSGADTILSVDVNGLSGGASFVQIGLLTGVNLGANVAALFASGNLVLDRDDVTSGTGGVDALDGGIGNDTLSGLGGNDVITGGTGNDTLDGGTGADDMSGGHGDDVFIVDNALDIVRENANEGTDLVKSSVSISVAAAPADGVENVTLTGTGNIDATGNALVNTLTGNSGDNSLDGGTGADKLVGGAGNDTYVIDDQGDVIMETSGIDTVLTDIGYTFGGLGAMSISIENLTFTGLLDLDMTGNAIANTITGNAGINTLDGAAGDDTLDGQDGNDRLIGGDGNDVLLGGNNDDVLIGSGGTDTLTGGAGADIFGFVPGSGIDIVTDFDILSGDAIDVADMIPVYNGNITDYVQLTNSGADTIVKVDADGLANGANFIQVAILTAVNLAGNEAALEAGGNLIAYRDDTITGGPFSDVLRGDFGDDTLIGGPGNDTLIGGLGDDDMSGGTGNDLFFVDSTADIVRENPGEGIDTVRSTVTYDISVPESVGVENIILIGGNLNATGNALANTLTGTAGDNTLDGGAGADLLIGGEGNDSFIIDNQGDVISDTDGIDTVRTDITYLFGGKGVMSGNIENLTMLGGFDINAIGNSGVNTITGNVGNNFIDGGGGNDTIIAGDGNDTLFGGAGLDVLEGGDGNEIYLIDSAGDTIIENPAEGTADEVRSSITYSIAALPEIEILTLVGTGNISGTGNANVNTLTGNTGVNTLDGGAGDDTLNGGGGLDTLIGGSGNDTYIVDAPIGTIIELPGGGTDIVEASISFSIAPYAEVENLTLTGTDDINGTGNINVNTITGNTGANTLDGGAGDDTLIGGDGNDTYIVDSGLDVVTENPGEGTGDIVMASVDYSIAPYLDVENLTLTGTAISGTGNTNTNIITGNASDNILDGGNGGNDILSGSTGADTLTTYGGNDTLDGGTGADTMDGGAGNDKYIVDNVGDVVTDGGGTDLISSSITLDLTGFASIENLTLTGSSAINGTGNALDNTITGNNGANVLDGGTSVTGDLLIGGGGADTLTTGTGDDTLNGGSGIDTMTGGDGNDLYFVDNVSDVINENPGEGNDTISTNLSTSLVSQPDLENITLTGSGALTATGNDSNNTLIGNTGANTLDGGLGQDVMTGGSGRDTFMFTKAPAAGNEDTITDFTAGASGDILNVHNILSGYTGVITDYVQVTQVGVDTIVSVDADGLTGGVAFVQVATLSNVNLGTDEAALATLGTLVV